MKIEINQNLPAKVTLHATDTRPGLMFRDCDGDLYVRTYGGAVRFDGNHLVNYSDSELDDLDFFSRVQLVEGDISIKVDLT